MLDMAATLPGASVWEEHLYQHLSSHVENERGILELYQSAANQSGSKAFKYLVGLIIHEEIRHHRRFEELASSLRSDALMSRDEPEIPFIDWWTLDHSEIKALTDQLIHQEEADQQDLRRLRHEMRDVEDTTLWSLLVQLMEADTAKHLSILKFVKKHVKLRV